MQQQPRINSSAFVAKELAMFRELLTGRYGNDIQTTWWDHFPYGCGMSAAGGFRSSCPVGAFPRAYPSFIEAVRTMAPQLLITNGPDAGNSRARAPGNGDYPVWNTCSLDPQYPAPMKVCKSYGPGQPIWQPRQTPDSIQNDGRDWFWHPHLNITTMTASHIWQRWLTTVGGGSHYLLNVPPNSSGLIPEAYAAVAKAFGDGLRSSIGSPVAQLADHSGPCSTPVVLRLPPASGVKSRAVDTIQVREEVWQHGQRIAGYALDALAENGTWIPLSVEQRPRVPNGAQTGLVGSTPPLQLTVGHRVVDVLKEPLKPNVKAVRFRCLSIVNGTSDDKIYLASMLATSQPTFT